MPGRSGVTAPRSERASDARRGEPRGGEKVEQIDLVFDNNRLASRSAASSTRTSR